MTQLPGSTNDRQDDTAQVLAGFVDTQWYAEQYPEVIAAGWEPLQHYMTCGAAEGRDPNPWFNGAWYQAYYPHVMTAGVTPLEHYLRSGARALRNPHPRFDAAWYVAQHPEAAENPLVHHVRIGAARGWPTQPATPIAETTQFPQSARVGIGIVTYNRKDLLRQTIRRVRQYTRRNDIELVVADDGSSDGTLAMLRRDDVPVITGARMGVAWNKNRALYLLAQVRGCEVVILLEDDTMPDVAGWEAPWIEAAWRWGHVNYAGSWVAPPKSSGTGTPGDPFMDDRVTAQCAAFSRNALNWAGYFDSRFQGYGLEHIEHSRRLISFGYGGTHHTINGIEQPVMFAMIRSGVEVRPSVTTRKREEVERNDRLLREILGDEHYRAPWRDRTELKQFRAEIDSAVAAWPDGFALSGAARGSGLFGLARLFRRRT